MTGTIISYYFYCKRRCWLSYNKISMEQNSEDVRIGNILHLLKGDKDSEISIDNIKIDKISSKYVTEFKKSDVSMECAEMQLLFYLYVLKNKGIVKIGKLEFYENKEQSKKSKLIYLDDTNEKKIINIIEEIEIFLNNPYPPIFKEDKKCKKCSYYEYCKC